MTDYKPCGTWHPLPCGLDVECPVAVAHFDVELSDEAVVKRADTADSGLE